MIDHKKGDTAISKVDSFIKSIGGKLSLNRTAHVWKLLLEQKDGSVDWVPLRDLKHSNRVELA